MEAERPLTTNLNKYRSTHPFAVSRISHFFDELTRLIKLASPRYVLNVGCGEGFDVKNLGERNADLAYCCGLDLNPQALKVAQELSFPFRFDAIHGDAYRLPLRLDGFDMILCLEILEHLRHPEAVLMEIAQRHDQYCVFSVPNEPFYRLTRLLILRKNVSRLGDHPEHVNHWSRRSFTRLVSRHFTVDEIATPFPWTIVLCRKKGAIR